MTIRSYTSTIERLRSVGLRPTRQRLALARLLFDNGNRHVTAEQLHAETGAAKIRVSMATIYNTLHQFVATGLLREVGVESGRSYFDTNTAEHHHFYAVDTGELSDIPDDHIALPALPPVPEGAEIDRVDVVIRIRKKK
jgi:Fur family iron response transcriptional regulator